MKIKLDDYIRDIQDFPKPGVLFKDITPLLQNHEAMNLALQQLVDFVGDQKIDKVVGIEARGFFFGTLLAQRLNAGFTPIRKPGKLPFHTFKESYQLEYGTDTLEIHEDAIKEGENILLHDDILATGGTAAAACKLIEKMGGNIIQCNFLVELELLNGRDKFKKQRIHSLMKY